MRRARHPNRSPRAVGSPRVRRPAGAGPGTRGVVHVRNDEGGSEAVGRGAYGLELAGMPGGGELLRPAPAGSPPVRVSHQVGGRRLTDDVVTEDVAHYRLEPTGGDVWLDRAGGTAHFAMDDEHDAGAFVHPFLAMAGAIFSRWLDRDAVHAGTIVVDGRAWGLLGAREAGKSSLTAMAHLAGLGVLTDDVLVVADGVALPGPGCIDLRPGAAAHLGVGEHIGTIGRRPRYRLAVDDVGPAPLAGWVLPTWADTIGVEPVPPAQRLALLLGNLALTRPPRDPGRILDLAMLPFLTLSRPQRWEQAPAALEALLSAVA